MTTHRLLRAGSRRTFLGRSGSLAAGSLIGGTLGGCAAIAAPPTPAEQSAMDSTQALAAIRSGRLSAQAYVGTSIARAEQLAGAHGVFNMSPTDHLGLDQRARVMVKIDNGQWKLVP